MNRFSPLATDSDQNGEEEEEEDEEEEEENEEPDPVRSPSGSSASGRMNIARPASEPDDAWASLEIEMDNPHMTPDECRNFLRALREHRLKRAPD